MKAGVILNRRDIAGHNLLKANACRTATERPCFRTSSTFASRVLGWSFSPKGYAGTDEAPIPPDLELSLPESGGVFRPDFAVRAERANISTPRPSVTNKGDGEALFPRGSSW